MTDYYELLQVHPTASDGVIEKAYKVRIMQEHPDRGGDSETARLLIEGYRVLSDPQKRAAYDRELLAEFQRHSVAPVSVPTVQQVEVILKTEPPRRLQSIGGVINRMADDFVALLLFLCQLGTALVGLVLAFGAVMMLVRPTPNTPLLADAMNVFMLGLFVGLFWLVRRLRKKRRLRAQRETESSTTSRAA